MNKLTYEARMGWICKFRKYIPAVQAANSKQIISYPDLQDVYIKVLEEALIFTEVNPECGMSSKELADTMFM